MGILTGIASLPIAPLRGVVGLAELIERQAEDVHHDPRTIRAELEAVEQSRRDGVLSETEADAREQELLERLMNTRGPGGR